MAVSTLLIADMRSVMEETSLTKLNSSMQTLNQKWNVKDVMPPFIDVISGLFPANIMRKPAITTTKKKPIGVLSGSKTLGSKLSTRQGIRIN